MDRSAGTYRGDRTGVVCVRVGDTEDTGRTEDHVKLIYYTCKLGTDGGGAKCCAMH